MKNRKREICTSGTVRDEDGNILIYSARPPCKPHRRDGPASETLNIFDVSSVLPAVPLAPENRTYRCTTLTKLTTFLGPHYSGCVIGHL